MSERESGIWHSYGTPLPYSRTLALSHITHTDTLPHRHYCVTLILALSCSPTLGVHKHRHKHADTYTHTHTHKTKVQHTRTHTDTHTHTLPPSLSPTHTARGKTPCRQKRSCRRQRRSRRRHKRSRRRQKNFADAKNDLDADPENQVLQAFFTSAKDLFNSAKDLFNKANKDVVLYFEIRRQILQGMKKGHAQRIIRERPKLLEAEDDRYDASSIYVPHEIKNIDELRIPSIRPIPVNRGQTSLPGRLPWCADTPLNGILKVTQYNSCQISKDVINFLTENVEFLKRDPAASENRIHPLVNFFTNIVLNTVGDNVVTFQRNKRDPSSQSESGSPKRTFYRADVIYFVNGLPLVRIEEKPKSKDLRIAQAELVDKISQDWLTVECTTRFVIGIAVAGNIWTFHRITCEDVRKCRENKGHVVKEWERIDILTDYGRLRGVQVAVHIASLLKFFAEVVHPRTVKFGKKINRNQSRILITANATLGLHVKKWYVSQIQCYSDICLLSSMHAVIYICNHKRLV